MDTNSDKKFSITLNKSDIELLDARRRNLILLDQKLQMVRKKSLLGLLEDGTNVRKDIIQKVKGWLDLIDARLMNPDTLNELEINKVISIFKSIMAFTTKITGQMNDLDQIFMDFSNINNPISNNMRGGGERTSVINNTIQTSPVAETAKAKEEIIKILMDGMKKNASEAETIENKKEETEKKIKENLPDCDIPSDDDIEKS